MPTSIFVHRQFVESWQRLAAPERAQIQRLLDLLATDDITPGMRPHRVGPFTSFSPNMDLRVIAARSDGSITLLYVDHHDVAYRWAESRTVLAATTQFTELVTLASIDRQRPAALVAECIPIPILDLLELSDETSFLAAISDMSPEWQEWLLEAYTEGTTTRPTPTRSSLIFCPPDDEALAKALSLDLPAWQVFLHPRQRDAVEDLDSSSIAITGGPGTGKTVVLLNRLIEHAPKGRDTDCAVLLAYSEALADHLQAQLRGVSNRHFYVFPMYYLAGQVPRNARRSVALRKVALVIEDGRALMQYRNGDRRVVRELLVDETQDVPPEVTIALQALIEAGKTRVVLAADLDQSIHRLNQGQVDALVGSCAAKYDMTYCYRSTRQIMDVARAWLSAAGATLNTAPAFALSGPRVRFIQCKGLSGQVAESVRVLRDMRQRYQESGLALVYCQYFNPSFKGGSKEEEELKRNPDTSRYYRFASLTKGKEYLAGVLFISSSFLATQMPEAARRLRLNTLYVALTRFRDEVTLVYTSDCHIEPILRATVGDATRAIDFPQGDEAISVD